MKHTSSWIGLGLKPPGPLPEGGWEGAGAQGCGAGCSAAVCRVRWLGDAARGAAGRLCVFGLAPVRARRARAAARGAARRAWRTFS